MQDKKIIKLMDIKRETVYLASLLRGVGKLLFYLKGESRTMSMATAPMPPGLQRATWDNSMRSSPQTRSGRC